MFGLFNGFVVESFAFYILYLIILELGKSCTTIHHVCDWTGARSSNDIRAGMGGVGQLQTHPTYDQEGKEKNWIGLDEIGI